MVKKTIVGTGRTASATLKHSSIQAFRHSKWYDSLQYSVLWLTVAAVVVNWRAGLWMTMLLLLVTIVKIIAQRKIGNPALSRMQRWALCAPIVYWLVLALSLLWTTDLHTGLEVLRLKAVLLVCPLCFLLSDTSYFNSHFSISNLQYPLLLALCGSFAYFALKAGLAVQQGTSFLAFQTAFFENRDVGEVYHHAYIALYAVVAIVFVYFNLVSRWKTMKGWLRALLILSLPLLICYVVVVNSRAGMLAMGLTLLACVVHLIVMRRNWKLGLGVSLLAVVSVVAATQLVPGYTDRITSTLENVQSDARTSINRCNWHAYCKSPLLGYGVGDYHVRQVEQYTEDGFENGANASFNAHNQYLESLLAAGIPGLLALLLLLLSPLLTTQTLKHSSIQAFITAVLLFNLLFESMLERQMGLLFVGWLLPAMVLILSEEENKFARSPKS